MNKIYILIILLMVWQCRKPQTMMKPGLVFIYDSEKLFQSFENSNDSLKYQVYRISKTIPKYIDTFLISKNYANYELIHYCKYSSYRDTSFVMHKSQITSTNFYDANFLKSKEKLDSFWLPVDCWRCGGIYDTAKIFLVIPLKGTDSLKFLQVHRSYHTTQ